MSPEHGYLKSVLELLKVPVESQTLVFSKTSFQYPKISPEHPRALYYNDDVYVGAVHDGNAIEIVSFDPKQGAIFYLLDERKVDKPVFQRAELDCTQCHIAAGTRGVPGVLLRSVFPTPDRHADAARAVLHHRPGKPAEAALGRLVRHRRAGQGLDGQCRRGRRPGRPTADRARPARRRRRSSARWAKPFDPAAYLAPGSDQVALLVLAHQTQMHNLITLTNYQTRLALYALAKKPGADVSPIADARLWMPAGSHARQIEKPADQLLRYLLFANETPLGGLDAQKADRGIRPSPASSPPGRARLQGPLAARLRPARPDLQAIRAAT